MRKMCKSFVALFAGMVLLALTVGVIPRLASAESAEELYNRAKGEYQAALANTQKEQRVEGLKKCIQQFQQVQRLDTQGKLGDKCEYLVGQCYHSLHDTKRAPDDLKTAIEHYRGVVQKYPASALADDAQYLIGILYMPDNPSQAYLELAKVRLFFPKGDMRSKAAQKAAQLGKQLGCERPKQKNSDGAPPIREKKAAAAPAQPTGSPQPTAPPPPAPPSGTAAPPCPTLARLERIQHWSDQDYTRVVLYTSGPVTYKESAIAAEPKTKQPGKIYLELRDCVINPKMKPEVRINDQFLQGVRAEQCDSTLARVVLDTAAIDSYRVFPLADPSRLIIDVRAKRLKPTPEVPKEGPKDNSQPLPSLARQLSLDVKRIVIDPGHGGKDKGAIGPGNVYEKNITLAIAKQLKKTLETKTGCEVLLTRTRDRFLSLEERTAIANSKKADLFISIHTNANEDSKFHGVETYFLNLSKDKESARVAAFENATSTKRISDLEAILQDLMLNTKINESARLAAEVQNRVVKTLKNNYENVRDLGTKQAPFYVLIGAEMPCILIETAFITNEEEEARLKDSGFQERMAKGITSGIESYIQKMRGFAKAGDRR